MSRIQPAQPATIADFTSVARGQADDGTLARVVLESLMLARASEAASMARAWILVAVTAISLHVKHHASKTMMDSLHEQILAALEDLSRKHQQSMAVVSE